MQLSPRYGDRPILSVEVWDDGEHPVMRQRRRLEGVLRDLSEAEWHTASRCEGWSVQDVIIHLSSTNSFWAFSISAGLAGEPSTFLATFDPVASPAELVEGAQGTSVAHTLGEFTAGNDALSSALTTVDGPGWAVLAEAPPGHLPIRLVADHALWDAWIHERDVLVPLGRAQTLEADEVRRCLRYAVGLGRAFAVSRGDTDHRSMVVAVADPVDRVVVVTEGDHVRIHAGEAPADAARIEGDAVALVELLSMRDPGVEPPAGLSWLTRGLAEVFDTAPST